MRETFRFVVVEITADVEALLCYVFYSAQT
jgi:hypothetical protein